MRGNMALPVGAVLLLTFSITSAEQEHTWHTIVDKTMEQCFSIAVKSKSHVHIPQLVAREILSCYALAAKYLIEERNLEMNSTAGQMLNFTLPIIKLTVTSSKAERPISMNTTIMVTSHQMLRGNFTFTHFSMAYSGIDCPYDAVVLFETFGKQFVKYRKLCGIRESYSYFAVGRKVIMMIQISGVMPLELKITIQPVSKGQIIDTFIPNVIGISKSTKEAINKTIPLPHKFFSAYHVRYKGLEMMWKLRADAGFRVKVTISQLTNVRLIQMYEGGIILPEMLRFHYENQTKNDSALSDISSAGPVLTVIVHSRFENYGLIYYTQRKATLNRQTLSVGNKQSLSITDMCHPDNNVISCYYPKHTYS